MANEIPTTADDLAKYYSGLLIAQYGSQDKAVATIRALAKELAAGDDGTGQPLGTILRDVFNLETATGAQLDILGKYVGVRRYIYGTNTSKLYFGFPLAADTWNNFYGFLLYSEIVAGGQPITKQYWMRYPDLTAYLGTLDDDTFRRLIKYLILLNTLDLTMENIEWLFNPYHTKIDAFGNYVSEDTVFAPSVSVWGRIYKPVSVTDGRNMSVTYTIASPTFGAGYSNTLLLSAITALGAWPKPAGVSITIA